MSKLFTSTKIGVEKFAKGKGVNKDLIAELISLLEAKNCQFKFTSFEGQSDWLNKKIDRTLATYVFKTDFQRSAFSAWVSFWCFKWQDFRLGGSVAHYLTWLYGIIGVKK